MNFFVSNFKWIMFIAGLLTCSMFYAAFAPQASLESNFGQSLRGPIAEIVVRNWGALIGLSGGMLIYGAFVPSVRPFVLVIAGLGKAIFIVLVLTYGRDFLEFGAGVAVVADSTMIVLFVIYLLVSRRQN